tara:strand:- start:555 stop:683 length:129 start_codon:yes stop_codon:yes gene_type:complete
MLTRWAGSRGRLVDTRKGCEDSTARVVEAVVLLVEVLVHVVV